MRDTRERKALTPWVLCAGKGYPKTRLCMDAIPMWAALPNTKHPMTYTTSPVLKNHPCSAAWRRDTRPLIAGNGHRKYLVLGAQEARPVAHFSGRLAGSPTSADSVGAAVAESSRPPCSPAGHGLQHCGHKHKNRDMNSMMSVPPLALMSKE